MSVNESTAVNGSTAIQTDLHVDIVNSARAILSERASDFDAFSAYGEVLDNSVEAESQNIKIQFDISADPNRGKNFKKIDRIAFGDDGIGMDADVLHRCLQLGYSSRYGSRKGIGRFGVGMTKAAIHECKRVEVYSKASDTQHWNYVYIDIDEIVDTNDSSIKTPTKRQLPSAYTHLVNSQKGTLVIWSKYDRQDQSADKIIDETKIWVGRTFRKFIFDGIKFYLNNEEIKAIDPLYLNPEFTNFPEDPKAEFRGEDTIRWIIDDPDLFNGGGKESIITIRFSALPKEFLKAGRRLAGNESENIKRHIPKNEGISILRNNREVRDPQNPIPFWSPQFKEVDRWWGCEISFDAELDNWFQVRNIKRGAAPIKELREALQEKINPVRNSIVKEVQAYWDSLDKPDSPDPDTGIEPKHKESEKIAKETVDEKKPTDKAGLGKNPDQEIKDYVETHFGQLSEEQRSSFIQYFKKSLITITEQASPSPSFFEVVHFGDGKKTITYNTKHEFFQRYFSILQNAQDNFEGTKFQEEILVLIDLLIVAFSLAESEFDREATMKARDFFEDMSMSWGKHLRNLFNTWKENEAR